MKVSVIIPAYNEESTIKEVVRSVKNKNLGKKIEKEIIVVNDASTDKTSEIISKLKGIKTCIHKKNMGKGAAVRTGIEKSTGDIVMIQDADLEYDPRYIPALIKPIIEGKTGVVYGTRLKNYPLKLVGAKRTPLVAHYLGNKFLSLVTSMLYGTSISDMETGYKVFHRSVIKDIELKSRRFDLEPEITAKILKRHLSIIEVPIKTVPRGYDEGKKITWRDGFIALWTLVKYRFAD